MQMPTEMNPQADTQRQMLMQSITSVKENAEVPVYVGERTDGGMNSILISEVKMVMIIGIYDDIYAFTHRAWRNLPPAPSNKPVHLVMWMIATEDYGVNHNAVTWEKAHPRTFAYLWSMIARLTNTLEVAGMGWIIGGRDSLGYCEATGMEGPTDRHLHTKMPRVPLQVALAADAIAAVEPTAVEREFVSLSDSETAMMPGVRRRTRQ